MKFTKSSIVLFICCFLLLGVVRKAEALSFAEYAYQRARVGQVAQITGYMQRGYPIDAVSSNGYTALCYATEAGDYGAYRLLRRLGANATHRCMQAVNADNATNFAQRYQPEASVVAKKTAEEKVNPMWQYAAVGGIVAGGAAAVAWWANEDDNDNGNNDNGDNPEKSSSETVMLYDSHEDIKPAIEDNPEVEKKSTWWRKLIS